MCEVIVADSGRSRSTNLGRDAYIHDHCLGYRHDYSLFYQFPNNNLFTHRMLFSWEKPLVKTTASDLFPIIFNLKIPCCTFSLFFLFYVLVRSIYQISYNLIYLNIEEGLTTPLTHWVASFCCLCAGVVYIVLLGSPTGLMTLVSALREIPTAPVVHHPFLFGEILTRTRAITHSVR